MVIKATTISLLPLVSVTSLLWSKKGRQGCELVPVLWPSTDEAEE